MSQLKDLIGQHFGRLTVISRAENTKKGQARWLCCCDCGNKTIVETYKLTSGNTKSCGCLRKEQLTQRNIQNSTHHMTGTKYFNLWHGIKQRCFNRNLYAYKDYGGRGITVYPEWIDNFQAFYDYVSKLEHFGEKGYSLDRIDNNGNYEPGNVRWANQKTQCRNKRNNALVEYNGRKISLIEASEASDIDYEVLKARFSRGDTGEKLFTPVRHYN